jgi:hypothetical protein
MTCDILIVMKKIFHILVYLFALIGFILTFGYFAIKFKLTNTNGIIDNQENYFQKTISSTPNWINTPEWQVLKESILKDEKDINEAAEVVEISPRLLVSPLVVEQLRLFYSEREVFKAVFAPLKILGNQSQFSWGVMGIKPETAMQIEKNLKDPLSYWYLGKEYENLLDFKTDTPDQERFERLTNEDSRYYSYLYAAILIKQLETQWQKAGYPIDNKPDIIATLFNIGFTNSKPKPSPLSGGAEIEIDGVKYSFGSLARSFYESKELEKEFSK